jgi:hypothetical protein
MPPTHLCRLAAICLATIFAAVPLHAATVTLDWDPSASPDVMGYVVGWRPANATAEQTVDVGNVSAWTSGSLPAGQTFVFSVRAYDSARVMSDPVEITGLVLGGVLLRASSRPQIGATTTWTAAATGFESAVEYQFRRFSPAAGWVVARDWSPFPSFSWTPSASETGRYLLDVSARRSGSRAPFEAQTSTGYFTVGDGSAVAAVASHLDYDGDGRADPAVFRPETGTWYALLSGSSHTTFLSRPWGVSTDVPVPGDYDGDGLTDLAVYRPTNGRWFILNSAAGTGPFFTRDWGVNTDIPVPGDYDGDRRIDIAVFRPAEGKWYLLLSTSAFTQAQTHGWGIATDVPVPGDYDGDGLTDLAVFRPSAGTWYVLESGSGFSTAKSYRWGASTDRPVPADYDGDGRTDVAIFRPSTGTWWILPSQTGFSRPVIRQWGIGSDLLTPDDYDGDGRADSAVFRPGSGTWFVLDGFVRPWGLAADAPPLAK